jgi:hypothetical protein
MDFLNSVVAAVVGVSAGIMLISVTARWIYTIYSTVRTARDSAPQRPLWALPISIFLHSGPWVLAIVCGVSYYALPRPHGDWLYGFFAGMAVSPLFVAWKLRSLLRRKRVVAPSRS